MNQLLQYFGEELQYTAFHPEPTKKPKPAEFGKYSLYEATLKSWNKEGYGVYFTVNKVKPGSKRTEEQIVEARAVWIEDDGEKHGPTDPSKFPIPPSLVISSSPGKFHYYWFTNTKNLEEWQQVIDKMAEDYNGDPGGTLKTQVLRIPGYVNTKYNNNSLVSIENGNFRVYGWNKIKEAFPPGKKKRERHAIVSEENSDELRLDLESSMQKILSGESLYPVCERLSMSLANTNMPTHAIISILRALINSADADEARKVNVNIKMRSLVESAQGKVARERVNRYKIEEVGSLHTELDWPPGFTGVVAKSINRSMPYPSREIAICTAFHCISVLGCGCYHYKGKTVSRVRTILAQTGRGKQSAADYFYELLNRVAVPGVHDLFVTDPSHSPFNNHMDMNANKCRSLITPEAGLVKKKKSGDPHASQAWLLSATSAKVGKAPLKLTVRSKGNSQNQHNEQNVKAVRDPVLCVLDEAQPETYLPTVMNEKQEETGALARSDVFFIGPEYEFNQNHDVPIEQDIVEVFETMISQYLASDCMDGTDPNYKSSKMVPVDFSQVEDDLLKIANDVLSRHGDGLLRSVTTRMHEKLIVTCITMARADSQSQDVSAPPEAVVTPEHFKYALYYHQELNRAIIANSTHGYLASAMDRSINYLETYLKAIAMDADEGRDAELVRRENGEKIIGTDWLGRKLRSGRQPLKDLSSLYFNKDSEARKALMEEAVDRGLVIKKSNRTWVVNL